MMVDGRRPNLLAGEPPLCKQGLPPPHPRPRLRDAPEVLERVVVSPPDGTQMLSALLRPSLQVHIDIAM
jgi:hypothetical protein